MNLAQNAVFMDDNKERAARWAHLTEGIKGDYDRRVVEVLMDNTKNFFEQQYRAPLAQLQEMNTTANVDPFTTYAFPLIRRIYPDLIGKELVSIQPIPQPTGKVFYIDFQYGADLAPTAKGDQFAWDDNAMAKFNPYYAAGRAKGEIIGVGDGTKVLFNTKYSPVFPESVVVYINAVSTTSYTLNAATGAIELGSATAADGVVTVDMLS